MAKWDFSIDGYGGKNRWMRFYKGALLSESDGLTGEDVCERLEELDRIKEDIAEIRKLMISFCDKFLRDEV